MVNGKAINCDQVWREVSNYLEGDLDPGLRAAMDEHFRTCKKCTSVLEGMRNVIRLYGDERMMEVPVGFGRRLERRLAQQPRSRRSWPTWSTWLIPAAALVLMAGGLRLANSMSVAHPLLSEHAQQGHDIPPDMLVVVTAGAKDFHLPQCTFIHNKNTERTLTASEAIQRGYVPCVRCLRKYLQAASMGRSAQELNADADQDAENEHARGQ